jgi:alanine racemase
MNKSYRTWIELSRQALLHNVAQLKNALNSTQLAVVLKSNAYGHGALAIASLLDNHPLVEWFCTAGLSEALSLRKHGIKKKLIALSYLDEDYQEAIVNDIHCSVYTYEDALNLSQAAQSLAKLVYVHVKVDTGMSRLGILPQDALTFIKTIQQLPYLQVYGIFTHLCDTSNPDQSFSYCQLECFDNVLATLEAAGISIPCTHAQSSSGLCIDPKRNYTFLRAGASVYGLWKSVEHKKLVFKQCPYLDLRPVMTWKTRIIQLKTISSGACVGYNRTYKSSQPTKIAIVPVGYCEGYSRRLSNAGSALIGNQLAPVIGIVSMNLTTFDVTHIPNVSLYDEVLLLGTDGISPAHVARTASVITNEIVSCINPEIPRIIV